MCIDLKLALAGSGYFGLPANKPESPAGFLKGLKSEIHIRVGVGGGYRTAQPAGARGDGWRSQPLNVDLPVQENPGHFHGRVGIAYQYGHDGASSAEDPKA